VFTVSKALFAPSFGFHCVHFRRERSTKIRSNKAKGPANTSHRSGVVIVANAPPPLPTCAILCAKASTPPVAASARVPKMIRPKYLITWVRAGDADVSPRSGTRLYSDPDLALVAVVLPRFIGTFSIVLLV